MSIFLSPRDDDYEMKNMMIKNMIMRTKMKRLSEKKETNIKDMYAYLLKV